MNFRSTSPQISRTRNGISSVGSRIWRKRFCGSQPRLASAKLTAKRALELLAEGLHREFGSWNHSALGPETDVDFAVEVSLRVMLNVGIRLGFAWGKMNALYAR